MRKLDKDDIIFIDTYLHNSAVNFIDIRLEMVDHVASEIEMRMANGDSRDFYYVFKDYMVENKADLLDNNEKFIKSADKFIGKRWLKHILSIRGVFVFAVAFIGLYGIVYFYNDITAFKIFRNIPLGVLVLVTIIYLAFIRRRKARYSAIERLGFFFLFLTQLIDFFMKIKIMDSGFMEENNLIALVFLSILITLSVCLLSTAFQLKKEYQLKFNSPI